MPRNWVASVRIEVASRSVVTESASLETMVAIEAGSSVRIFLAMAEMTMRWLAAR